MSFCGPPFFIYLYVPGAPQDCKLGSAGKHESRVGPWSYLEQLRKMAQAPSC